MARDDVTAAVTAIAKPALAGAGYGLVDVEFARSHGAWVLRFFIERSSGEPVTIGDCQAVSQLLDPLLDAEDVVHGPYVLEVSSPGIDRRVRWPEDFDRFAGETVEMQFLSPLEGRRKLSGTLHGMANDQEVLVEDSSGKTWHVPLHVIRRANLRRL